MTVEQYITLLTAAPLIESALAKKNVQVPRPDYDADFSAAKASKDDETVQDAGKEEEKEEAVGKVDDDGEDEEK